MTTCNRCGMPIRSLETVPHSEYECLKAVLPEVARLRAELAESRRDFQTRDEQLTVARMETRRAEAERDAAIRERDRADRCLREIRDMVCGLDISVGSVPEQTAQAVRVVVALLQSNLETAAALRSRLGEAASLIESARVLAVTHNAPASEAAFEEWLAASGPKEG